MNQINVPNHIAIVLDGNRRWARKHHMPIWVGHKEGAENFEKFLDWCAELNIPNISAYILSTENLENRPKKELDELFKLYYEFLEKYLKKEVGFFDKYQMRVRFIGDLDRLPPKLVRLMGRIMLRTAKYQKHVINFLMAYGSKFEITNAIKIMASGFMKAGKIQISEKDVERNLLVPVPVDLVVRTGGMHRLSNFLLWQSAYAEIYVTKTLWPDFNKKELIKAIRWFNSVQKNFGK